MKAEKVRLYKQTAPPLMSHNDETMIKPLHPHDITVILRVSIRDATMGCDIHMMAEVYKDNRWEATGAVFDNAYYEPEKKTETITYEDGDTYTYNPPKTANPYDNRNYRLFGFLADVRNGYGFAGVDTGDAIKPIAMPRGIPADASQEYLDDVKKWDGDGHSHSYLTLKELQEADWDQTVTLRGVVSAEVYRHLKDAGESHPKAWSGSIVGPNIVTLSETDWNEGNFEYDPHARYHIQMEWQLPLRDVVGDFLTRTTPSLQALGAAKDVRIVFFFDN